MRISREFLERISKEVRVPSVINDLEQIQKLVKAAVYDMSREDSRINPDLIAVYLHGSYENNTNIYFPSNLEVIVELRQPLGQDRFRLFNDYYVELKTDFTPADFADALYARLAEMTGGKATRERQVITLPPSSSGVKHKVEITPAFIFDHTSHDGGEFRGILVYDQSVKAHLVTFPRVHRRNGEMLDEVTRGNFLKMVRAYKTLNKMLAREGYSTAGGGAPRRGYFIQCMLFNVPRHMYQSDDIGTVFYSIFNYLMRADMRGFHSQNLVWSLFGIAPEFWNIEEADRFIRDLKKYEKSFDPTRTEIILK
ncbi:MAG: hypothetical protein FWE31_04255 [Firmicutes bacterium]|nr:hypothetical protein [Bacillota bacterium]